MNFRELGPVSKQTKLYGDGESYIHPSGHVYQRVNNRWEIVRSEITRPLTLWERVKSWFC